MSDLKIDETGAAIVPVLACVLNQLCLRNDRLPVNQKSVSKFHALRPPAISIKDYLLRVAKYAACSGECFVLALVYIDRIIQSNPNFVVNSLNIHRLLITSIMLAAKFFDDQYYNNAYYAKVGGVPCNEVNSLEVEFLFMCNFTLFVTTDTYTQYYTELCNHASNASNVCQCNSGPAVPRLNIPQFPLLSQPPADLNGNVWFVWPHQTNIPSHGQSNQLLQLEDPEAIEFDRAGGNSFNYIPPISAVQIPISSAATGAPVTSNLSALLRQRSSGDNHADMTVAGPADSGDEENTEMQTETESPVIGVR